MIPLLDEQTLRRAVTPRLAVTVVREAFRADGEGRTTVPPVINLAIPQSRSEFHIKSAYIEGIPDVAVKVASGSYDNVARGLPTGSGLMALFDAATGLPVALLLDNGYLTDVRTGAAGAVAADLLARAAIGTVGILGSGVQARHQIRCLATVRAFRKILAWSPTRTRLEQYCVEMRGEGFEASAASSPEEVCAAADVLVTATPAHTPLVQAEWLRPGVHVTAVGADSPGKQELDPACLARADLLVVDRFAQCAAFGELRHGLDAGLVGHADVHAELGAIVAGRKPGRTSEGQITVADLTGVGFQDTAIASAAYRAVLAQS